MQRAAEILLRLHQIELPARSTLATVRDQLAALADDVAARELALAIEPEWRNAIQHGQVFWDARALRLALGETRVDADEVLERYAPGVEAGIALAMTASPRLARALNAVAPAHGDRVLVEHRVQAALASSRAVVHRVQTVGDRLVISVPAREDLTKALGALVAQVDTLRASEAVDIGVDGLPPLVVTPDALRRVASLSGRGPGGRRILSPRSALPAMLVVMLAIGEAAEYALDVCTGKALIGVATELPAGRSPRTVARHIRTDAVAARRAISQLQTLVGAATPGSAAALGAVAAIERAAADFQRAGDAAREPILAAIARLRTAHAQLPDVALPSFEDSYSGAFERDVCLSS